ncbi:Histidyl-tRNA synthetase [invertebrate metagenome]|uniref:histidine--tRNA ligase n=1 Tax=invertebrate metagenome TaxID=1711999 RepID=A0A484H6C4_9ZZZZ
MSVLQPVRGTQDLLPDEARRHRAVEETFCCLAGLYGFGEIATPIIEFTEVFRRTLGETSDIVTKEMYALMSRGESLTLRPEGTSSVARAFLSNGLHHALPLKVFYRGPMFRRERPQKGRLRQFHQVGIELLGVENPLADAEVIAFAAHFLTELGLAGMVTLELNSLGDSASRAVYRAALLDYLEQQADRLSVESRNRLERNPLRILDSKDKSDQAIIADAPPLTDFLNQPSRSFLDQVCTFLHELGLKPVVNPCLVRGLDYYCHTTFEFTTTALGTQGTVLAGGRYDGLIQQMGGSAIAGIGWAAGVERLAMLYAGGPAVPRAVAIITVGAAAEHRALSLAQDLRKAGVRVDLGYAGSLAKRLKRAHKIRARAAVIVGDDELAQGMATVRDLDSGTQVEVPFTRLTAYLQL